MRIRRKGNLSAHIYYVKHVNQVAFFMIPGKDAPLLPSYVIQIVDTALSPPVPPDMEVRVLSINALISLFAKHPEIEIASEILPAFQSILFRINSMACNNDSDEYTRNRTRQIALTGLKSLFSTRIVENLPEEDRRKALTVIIVSLLDNLLTDSNKLDVLQHQVMPNLDYSPVDQLIYDPEKQEKVNIDEVQLAILSLSIYRQIFINITNKSLIEEIITPALDSLDKNKRWREVDWLNWMMENVLMWTPIQFRYLIPLTVLKLLLDSKETFPTTTKQSGYLHILAHLFSREDPVSGIQVMDIVEKLIEFAQYRFIIDNQDALAPMSINTLSKLATHTYYSDQIADMSAKIIDQMTTVQFHEKGNVRDDLLRLLLSSLSGILAAAYDGPATDIPSTPQETETPPYSPKGKEKAVIIPKLKVPVSNKRTRVSPLDWQRTVSLLIEPNYGVRVAYVRALAGFIEGELNLADTSHEVMFEKFVNALNASIYTLAICRNLADTNIIEEAEGTAHIDNSLSRLKKVAQMTHTKPSLPSNTATPSDFSALLSIIVALHRRDICQALLILVPFLRALDNHAIQLMLGPGLQSSGSRRGSFASWAASPSARSGLNVGVDERAKCKAIRELVARSWYEIGDRWGNERIKQLASDGLNRIGITLLSQPTQIDVREQPMFGLQTPQAMLFPSEDDWDQVHDGESSKTGRPIVDELKAIDVIVNDPSVIAATGLTKAELLERLQLEWTFERAVDVASKETYNKFVTDGFSLSTVTATWCVLYADFGEKEHVFSNIRREYQKQVDKLLDFHFKQNVNNLNPHVNINVVQLESYSDSCDAYKDATLVIAADLSPKVYNDILRHLKPAIPLYIVGTLGLAGYVIVNNSAINDQGETKQFKSLSELIESQPGLHTRKMREKRDLLSKWRGWLLVLAYWSFFDDHSREPTAEDSENFYNNYLLKKVEKAGLTDTSTPLPFDGNTIKDIIPTLSTSITPVHAVLGGFVAQDIISTVSSKHPDHQITMQLLRGNYAPIPTIYKDDAEQSIDYEAITAHVHNILKAGVVGIVAQGSTAEHVALSQEEKNNITKATRKVIDDNKLSAPLIAGVGAQSTWEAVKRSKEAASNGANFVLALPPSYFAGSLNEEALTSYYSVLADKSPLPVLIYSFPAVTSGINLSSDTIARLAKHKNIVGIKQTDHDVGKMARLTELRETNNFAVFAGASDYLLGALAVGAEGSITGAANFAPELVASLQKAYDNGDQALALKLQRKLAHLEGSVMKGGIPAIKYATFCVYGQNPAARHPVPLLSEAMQNSIKAAFK
ncbi:hypothetical protein E3Q01_03120 [Wallemia mellicola]|uniref:Dihydrodipicolinate synthase n=1 Tax=Wallemia mellicola TaxID=1708541 RepID=A0A4T0TEL6_9BASI|nr:hypothetical protein E3Q01_03120 [Wallemia mellicola]